MSFYIIYDLYIDMICATENIKARPFCRTGYFLSHSSVAHFALHVLVDLFNHPVSLLPSLCSRLSFFSDYSLVLIFNSLALIWLRWSGTSNSSCHSSDLLLINTLYD